jgi:hypothetical protein
MPVLVKSSPDDKGPKLPQSQLLGTNDPTADMPIRQEPFSVTLSALELGGLAVVLILGVHLLGQPGLDLCILLVPLLMLVRNDYANFLKLGPGGTPSTPEGYFRLQWYRAFRLRDPYSPPPREPGLQPSDGVLFERPLPCRPGPRPRVAGIAPQRQLTQVGAVDIRQRLQQRLESLASDRPDKFVIATSTIEKHGFAVYARYPVNLRGRGEVVHLHDSDGSMHLNLHPDDIKEVLQKGWGERHPISWTGWLYTPVSPTFTMIYSPRGKHVAVSLAMPLLTRSLDDQDLETIYRILEAGLWFTLAERVKLTTDAAADGSDLIHQTPEPNARLVQDDMKVIEQPHYHATLPTPPETPES